MKYKNLFEPKKSLVNRILRDPTLNATELKESIDKDRFIVNKAQGIEQMVPLMAAIKANRLDLVRVIASRKKPCPSIGIKDSKDRNIVCYCAEFGNVECLEIILEYFPKELIQQNAKRGTVLQAVLRSRTAHRFQVIEAFMNLGLQFSMENSKDRAKCLKDLRLAICRRGRNNRVIDSVENKDYEQIAKTLETFIPHLGNSVCTNIGEYGGFAHYLALYNFPKLLEKFLEECTKHMGKSTSDRIVNGSLSEYTPLQRMFRTKIELNNRDRRETMKVLMKFGADIDGHSRSDHRTPFVLSLHVERLTKADVKNSLFLLNSGASLSGRIRQNTFSTIILKICKRGQIDLLKAVDKKSTITSLNKKKQLHILNEVFTMYLVSKRKYRTVLVYLLQKRYPVYGLFTSEAIIGLQRNKRKNLASLIKLGGSFDHSLKQEMPLLMRLAQHNDIPLIKLLLQSNTCIEHKFQPTFCADKYGPKRVIFWRSRLSYVSFFGWDRRTGVKCKLCLKIIRGPDKLLGEINRESEFVICQNCCFFKHNNGINSEEMFKRMKVKSAIQLAKFKKSAPDCWELCRKEIRKGLLDDVFINAKLDSDHLLNLISENEILRRMGYIKT